MPRETCSETTRQGRPCGAPVTREGKCAGHLGLGLAASPEAAREANRAATRRKRELAAQREQERTLARQGVTARLRAQAATDAALLVEALFAPLRDESLSPVARQAAALKILARVFGTPGTAPPADEAADVQALTPEQLLAAWGEGDAPPRDGLAQ